MSIIKAFFEGMFRLFGTIAGIALLIFGAMFFMGEDIRAVAVDTYNSGADAVENLVNELRPRERILPRLDD